MGPFEKSTPRDLSYGLLFILPHSPGVGLGNHSLQLHVAVCVTETKNNLHVRKRTLAEHLSSMYKVLGSTPQYCLNWEIPAFSSQHYRGGGSLLRGLMLASAT